MRIAPALAAALALAAGCDASPGGGASGQAAPLSPSRDPRAAARAASSYLIHYGTWTEPQIRIAETYPLVAVHPLGGNLTRRLVAEIQDGVDPADPPTTSSFWRTSPSERTCGPPRSPTPTCGRILDLPATGPAPAWTRAARAPRAAPSTPSTPSGPPPRAARASHPSISTTTPSPSRAPPTESPTETPSSTRASSTPETPPGSPPSTR
jgi:hypothetical protein